MGKIKPIVLALSAAVISLAATGTAWANGDVIPSGTQQAINQVANAPLYKTPLTKAQQAIVDQAKLVKKDGWWHVGIKGKPFDRGFQYGYLIAPDFQPAWKDIWSMTYLTSGVPLHSWEKAAIEQTKGKIPQDLLDEMRGVAAGLNAAGLHVTLDDIITWNDLTELTGYWWPSVGSKNFTKWVEPGLENISKYPSPYKDVNKADLGQYARPAVIQEAHGNCSAFIATGKSTKTHNIVIGHETFDTFWEGQYDNVILDITPEKGYKMAFQTLPGYIESGTDFWETGAGLAFVETTIANVTDWKPDGIPEFIRTREAAQYASNIDQWVRIMQKGNNGGYANTWLIGNIHNGRIAKFGQGMVYQFFNETNNGYFTGENVSEDPRIRYIEGSDSDYSDIRQQEGARRLRWIQLMHEYNGKITDGVGERMLGDTYDVYLKKNDPSSRTICAEYDKDPQPFVSDPSAVWNVPFQPAGSVDGKVADSAQIAKLTIIARFGRANGQPFDAPAFIKAHEQWAWQAPYLNSRPSEPWAKMPFMS